MKAMKRYYDVNMGNFSKKNIIEGNSSRYKVLEKSADFVGYFLNEF